MVLREAAQQHQSSLHTSNIIQVLLGWSPGGGAFRLLGPVGPAVGVASVHLPRSAVRARSALLLARVFPTSLRSQISGPEDPRRIPSLLLVLFQRCCASQKFSRIIATGMLNPRSMGWHVSIVVGPQFFDPSFAVKSSTGSGLHSRTVSRGPSAFSSPPPQLSVVCWMDRKIQNTSSSQVKWGYATAWRSSGHPGPASSSSQVKSWDALA